MHWFRNEHTIASTCEIRGRGYWSGQDVLVSIHPANLGSGIQFVRTDLDGHPTCPALVRHRVDAALRTNLVFSEAKFQMVEHLMAALAALEIDNCIVEVDGEELPSLDGSAGAFGEALSHAGLIIQAAAKSQLVIDKRYRIGTATGWVEACPSKRGESFFEYQLSYDDGTPIQPQTFSVELAPDRFLREVSTARTFVTEAQADQIRSSGMAAHVTNQDLLVIGERGPIDNRFRFNNECARHKTLDMIGDLALSGVELIGRFTSFRGGHNLNGKMAMLLSRLAAARQQRGSAEQANDQPATDQTERKVA